MQRYFLEPLSLEKNIIVGDDVFHIRKVMRGQIGDKIIVCANQTSYLVNITEIKENEIHFQIVTELQEKQELPFQVDIIQGYPKGDKPEQIIMHSTELGVSNLYFVSMKRSIVKVEDSKRANKVLRYQKIAKEASEQSHRKMIPNIEICTWKEIDFTQYDLKLLLDEEEAREQSGRTLKSFLQHQSQKICCVIGPEGGIDPKERTFLLEAGFQCCSLGPRILRTETASLSFLSCVVYELEMTK